ncbi:MAG: HAMP domain-containing protein [Ferrovum sp.]|nr:HAMP domain-containing protein [Ferrovum sp.]NDU87060.1 HAMP domain-containing protein [Ferrovum sp.]
MVARSLLGRTLLVTILTVLITHLATLIVFQRFYVGPLLEHTIEDRANHIFTIISALENLPAPSQPRFIHDFDDSEGGVIRRDGPTNEQVRSPEKASRVFLLQARLRQKFPQTTVWIADRGTIPAVWISLHTSHGEFWYVTQRQRFDAGFPEKWALLLALVILVGVSSVYWAVRRINQPLQELALAAHRIGMGQPSRLVITPDIPREIREVSEAFRTMQHALATLESNRAVMLAGVSHDLRTPLSRLRLSMEMLNLPNPRVLEPMVQDLEEIDRIIDQFLDFARDQPHYPLSIQELLPLAQSCQERFISRGIPVELTVDSAVPAVRMNERAMERVINNLLENAVRYGRPPFTITLGQQGTEICLVIRDCGDGIPSSEVHRLLQPFTRRESSRGGPPGSGLGLAIVNRIVALHQGTLELRPPAQGSGLEVCVHLPALCDQTTDPFQEPGPSRDFIDR